MRFYDSRACLKYMHGCLFIYHRLRELDNPRDIPANSEHPDHRDRADSPSENVGPVAERDDAEQPQPGSLIVVEVDIHERPGFVLPPPIPGGPRRSRVPQPPSPPMLKRIDGTASRSPFGKFAQDRAVNSKVRKSFFFVSVGIIGVVQFCEPLLLFFLLGHPNLLVCCIVNVIFPSLIIIIIWSEINCML